MPSTPLFPFGHGLSYTTFAYGPLRLDRDAVGADAEVRASVDVTNTGPRTGTEVVQLYATDTATGVTRPAQQLVGFARVDLEPGATRTVTFTLPLSVLAYTGLDGRLIMEPGPVRLDVGSSSDDIRGRATLDVTGEAHAVDREARAFLSTATVSA